MKKNENTKSNKLYIRVYDEADLLNIEELWATKRFNTKNELYQSALHHGIVYLSKNLLGKKLTERASEEELLDFAPKKSSERRRAARFCA